MKGIKVENEIYWVGWILNIVEIFKVKLNYRSFKMISLKIMILFD